MGDEPAGVIERGLEEDLSLSPARPLDPGTEQHIGLPDLIAKSRNFQGAEQLVSGSSAKRRLSAADKLLSLQVPVCARIGAGGMGEV